MRYIRWLTPLLVFFVILFSLSACGGSLQKPTGLEETNAELQEDVNNNEENNGEDSTKAHEEGKLSADKGKKKAEEKPKDNKSTNDHETESNKATTDKQSDSSTNKSSNQSTQEEKSTNANNSNKSNSEQNSKNNPKKDQEKPDEGSKEEPKDDSNNDSDKNPEPKSTITHSIVISPSEIPLSQTKQEIENGDTALEALIAITKAKGLQMDYRGGRGATAYVEGIGNVYEFDRGQGSGWMFSVNGIFPDRGVGVTTLCDGDVLEWLYTTDLGKDLGADLQPFRHDGKCP